MIDDLDFNTTAFNATLAADEDSSTPTTQLNTPVLIVDDELKEREEQFFIVRLEVIDALNSDAVVIDRDVATVVIRDNDGKYIIFSWPIHCNCDLVHLTDIRIGFSRELYEYFEPSEETIITNITLVKDDNRVSEQTFRIRIVVSDPTSMRPATLHTEDIEPDSWDYPVGQVGQHFLLIDISPAQQSLLVAFILNDDDVPEGLEGFRLTAAGGFPQFLLPLQTSTTAFQSTTITVIDADGMLLTYVHNNSLHSVYMCSAQSCMGAGHLYC